VGPTDVVHTCYTLCTRCIGRRKCMDGVLRIVHAAYGCGTESNG